MAQQYFNEEDSLQKSLYWIGLLSILFMWILAIYYFPGLPDKIPSHFNGKGEVDGYASKFILFLLPIIGGFTWGLVNYAGNKPELYNFPVKITPQNKAYQYRLAKLLMRSMNALVSVMLLYIQWTIIQAALEEKVSMSIFIVFGMAGLIVAMIIYYFYLARRNQ